MPLSLDPPTDASKDDASLVPRLPRFLDRGTADCLRQELLDHQQSDLVIDASGVELLGARCAETLLSACRLWAKNGKQFSIGEASKAFSKDLALLGFTTEDLST